LVYFNALATVVLNKRLLKLPWQLESCISLSLKKQSVSQGIKVYICICFLGNFIKYGDFGMKWLIFLMRILP